ncbi:MAG: hypothetical protein NC094_02755 [Bacteroidales bacterium]|nr:hypothetical protein [Lachnoclostridium sp.]MCM1383470.1 hypothetical protein [Lachnoclostridium sp.]MCM1464319.1 hypothetical protein [Bacteroidales bacterium]
MQEKKTARMGRQVQAAAVLLCACLLLGGCTTKETAAKKLLEQRYGEEFVVHRTWSSGSSYAVCSPKNNKDVVFEISFSEDIDTIWSDRYLDAVVSLQISRKLEKELQIYFPGCYVHSIGDYADDNRYLSFSDIQSVTPEMYTERYPDESFAVYVYVEPENLQQDTVGEEYLYFSETLREEMEDELLPRLTILVYYVDAGQQNRLKQYFRTSDWQVGHTTYKDIIGAKSYDWGISYCEYGRPVGKIDVTYEEYKELRMGEKGNE